MLRYALSFQQNVKCFLSSPPTDLLFSIFWNCKNVPIYNTYMLFRPIIQTVLWNKIFVHRNPNLRWTINSEFNVRRTHSIRKYGKTKWHCQLRREKMSKKTKRLFSLRSTTTINISIEQKFFCFCLCKL